MRDACKALLFLILVASAGSQPPWNPQCFPGTTVCAVEGQQCLSVAWLGRSACSCLGGPYRGGHQCRDTCPNACGSDNPGCTAPCNSPRGECDLAVGACRCSPGYVGLNCTSVCPGGASNPCSGHGTCSTDEAGAGATCWCSQGWVGDDCSRTCEGGGTCSGHGVCTTKGANAGSCTCTAGWVSTGCHVECPGGGSNSCSGHGQCSLALGGQTSKCSCSYGYGGPTCAVRCPLFYGQPCGCGNQADPICRGRCGDAGRCECSAGFRGPACGMLCIGGPDKVCSNRGTCADDGSCSCYSGWTGSNCNIECPGGSATPCSGHGTCFAVGANSSGCACDSGIDGLVGAYEGPSCAKPLLNRGLLIAPVNTSTLPEAFQGRDWPAGLIPFLTCLAMSIIWVPRVYEAWTERRLKQLGSLIPESLFDGGVNPLAAEEENTRKKRRERRSARKTLGGESSRLSASQNIGVSGHEEDSTAGSDSSQDKSYNNSPIKAGSMSPSKFKAKSALSATGSRGLAQEREHPWAPSKDLAWLVSVEETPQRSWTQQMAAGRDEATRAAASPGGERLSSTPARGGSGSPGRLGRGGTRRVVSPHGRPVTGTRRETPVSGLRAFAEEEDVLDLSGEDDAGAEGGGDASLAEESEEGEGGGDLKPV